MGTMTVFEQLRTLDDVRRYIRAGYAATVQGPGGETRKQALEFGFVYGKLPLSVSECGPLIEHAVSLAGEDGLTIEELRLLFKDVGETRFERGLKFARQSGHLSESKEHRPGLSGNLRRPVVLRAV
jgi:hypothetical protein